MEELKMTVEEFVGMYANCRIPSAKTIRNNLNKIKGYDKDKLECPIPNGSRYPYRKNCISKRLPISFIIVSATYAARYIDATYFVGSEERFEMLVDDLVQNGILVKNKTNNRYGCNGYDVTLRGEEWLFAKKIEYADIICPYLRDLISLIV